MNESVNMGKYIGLFALFYSIATLVVAALDRFFDFDGGGTANLVLIMVAAMVAGGQFVQDAKRTPNQSEKIQLIGYSFLATWLISIILTGAAILIFPEALSIIKQGLAPLSAGLLTAVLIIITLIMLLMLWLGYGFLTNRQYQTLKKKGKL